MLRCLVWNDARFDCCSCRWGVIVPRWTRGWVWAGRGVAVVVVVGVAMYLYVAGLDRADKIASGLNLLVALVALGAPYLLPAEGSSIVESSGSQVASDVVVGGRLAQVSRIKGKLRSSSPKSLGSAQPPVASSSSASARASDVAPGGQAIRGAWVGGDVTQVGDVEGDVTLG